MHLHRTAFGYTGDADPHAPGGMAKINRACFGNGARNAQIIDDVITALARGRHCLVLTRQLAHLQLLSAALSGHEPIVLRGGMGAKARAAAQARLARSTGTAPLLAVATGSYIGEGFDCPVLDTLFLTAPIAQKGDLVQYVGRILRPHPGKSLLKCTTTTTPPPACSPPPWPNVHPATPAWASPTHASRPTTPDQPRHPRAVRAVIATRAGFGP